MSRMASQEAVGTSREIHLTLPAHYINPFSNWEKVSEPRTQGMGGTSGSRLLLCYACGSQSYFGAERVL